MGLFDSDSIGNFAAGRALFGGLFDNTDKKSREQIKGSQQLWNNLQTPDLKWTDYNPESFTPDDAIYSQISQDPELRLKQLSALSKLEGLSNEGATPEDELALLRARQAGDQLAKAHSDAAINDAQVRGVAGSGQEFAMREAASQAAAQRAQEAAMQAAAQKAQQRQAYLQAYGNQLNQVRGQDFTQNQANTNIINDFNKANTQARNQAGQNNVNARNDAQQLNNQGRINTQQQNFNNQATKIGGQTGANLQMANAYAAQNASRTAARNQDMKDFSSIMGMVGGGG